MLTPDDYKSALESLSHLTADFVHSANIVHTSQQTDDAKEWKQKALYITMMFDLVSSMNGIRQIVKLPNNSTQSTYKPRIYNPDNG